MLGDHRGVYIMRQTEGVYIQRGYIYQPGREGRKGSCMVPKMLTAMRHSSMP